jgi:YegS/Rv2252/BmrU family lipid kinase
VKVAVVAHRGKSIGGGLGELRRALADAGIADPLWHEVPKSKKAPKHAKRAVKDGADIVVVWGGDGMVQQVADALAGSDVPLAIVPAGTANLLASNLGIPTDIAACVKLALNGNRRRLDLGTVNGEHFAVMAGVGFDARMIRDADAGLKDRLGRLAYIWTGAKNLKAPRAAARIKVDGQKWFKGKVACVLVGNVGSLFGGVTVFEDARPDDGRLEVGVVTAKSAMQWMRALARTAVRSPERSPFVHLTAGKRITLRLDRPMPYELDGGDRPVRRRLRIEVAPGAVTFCVPDEAAER